MPAVRAEHDHAFISRMPLKNRLPLVSNKNRSAPSMTQSYVTQFRMQSAYALFQIVHQFGRLALGHIQFHQLAPIFQMHKAAAEDQLILLKDSSPQIRQVHGVKWLPSAQTQLGNPFWLERLGCH